MPPIIVTFSCRICLDAGGGNPTHEKRSCAVAATLHAGRPDVKKRDHLDLAACTCLIGSLKPHQKSRCTRKNGSEAKVQVEA